MKFLRRKVSDTNGADFFQFTKRHYGIANPDKTIFYIKEDNENVGFFAMYRYWLEYIYFADICGYVPVVHAGEHFAYKEKKPVNKTKNAFEYFFKQPTKIGIASMRMSCNVVHSELLHREMVEMVLTGKICHYKYNRQYLYMMARIVKKYIHFNDNTKLYIENAIKELGIESEKVLGIHIRGTDFRAKYDNHPIYVTEDEYFEKIDELLQKRAYDKLFLATDDKRILENFIKKYGRRLCYYKDTERGDKNRSVIFDTEDREQHKYLLGLEVIRDMYTLSKCDSLIAGLSQVAICAQIHKIARGERYTTLLTIDKGIYRNSHIFNSSR